MKKIIKLFITLISIYLLIGIIFASYNYFFGGDGLVSITKGEAFKIDIIGWPLQFLD